MHYVEKKLTILDQQIIHQQFDEIDSTHLYARKLASLLKNDSQIYLITAEHQTAGIGQRERKWVSDKGNGIYANLIMPIDNIRNDSLLGKTNGGVSLLVGYSIVKILKELGFDAQIKWVNDILINGKKVGGILCETTDILKDRCYMLIGFGINVKKAPEVIDQEVTSLFKEKEINLDLENLLYKIVENIIYNFGLFIREGKIRELIKLINENLAFKGDEVVLDDKISGILMGVDTEGAIEIKVGGEIKKFKEGRIKKITVRS